MQSIKREQAISQALRQCAKDRKNKIGNEHNKCEKEQDAMSNEVYTLIARSN